MSGLGRQLDALQGRPVILDISIGSGDVLAYNFNPMHRHPNRADYRTLRNGIFNWKAIVGAPERSWRRRLPPLF